MSGCATALRPSTKNVAFTHSLLSASSTFGVVPGHGPSSNVSTTSFASKGSVAGERFRPTRGGAPGSGAGTPLLPRPRGGPPALAGAPPHHRTAPDPGC